MKTFKTKWIVFSHKRLILSLVALVILVEVFLVSWNSESNDLDIRTNQFIFFDLDSHIIQLETDHLRVYSPHDCHCYNNSYIRVDKQKTDPHIYKIYLVKDSNEKFLYQLSEAELHSLTSVPCNLFSALSRGKRQSVVSYTLYGQNEFYYNKLKNLTQQIFEMYPGWLMRIYHDRSIKSSLICDLECNEFRNVDFCDVSQLHVSLIDDKTFLNASQVHALIWRYFPLGDDFVDIAVFRDSDSYILKREVDAVHQWLKSDQIVHIMRDHPMHDAAIMGGMWGMKSSVDRSLSKKIFALTIDNRIFAKFNPKREHRKGADQDFLAQHVKHLINDLSIVHDSFSCLDSTNAWPTRRQGNCFVGSPHTCELNVSNFYTCPMRCRPKAHVDWIYC